jgi:hypothetical protein
LAQAEMADGLYTSHRGCGDDCDDPGHHAQASAETDVVRGRPVWVQQLTELQQEFAEVSGKTFHSTWEDFLFVKLRAARVALAEARKRCYTAAQVEKASKDAGVHPGDLIRLLARLAALAAKEPK